MSAQLKAWLVSDGDWWELLHAETSGKARGKAVGIFSDGYELEDFLSFRATRFPKADGRAFTVADRWEVDGKWVHGGNYISECDCVYCSPKSTEVSND